MSKAIAPDKVAIYIRWSTEDQGEGTTLDVQREGCCHYVLSQGWRVREDLTFIDDGYSGATLERPGLTRLRALVRAGEVECVVVYKLDRLSRSVADTARLCMDEWDGICCVKSAREPIDTTSQAGKMFFYTLMNYAEWERAVIRERTHSGRVRRAQEGRDPGYTIPYGYARDGQGAFVAVPHEAAVVKRIFELYRMGLGLTRLVETLNGEGLPFRGGRKWQVQTVAYLLANRAYTGDLVWGRRMRNPRYGKREGERARAWREEPLVAKEGVFPAIISREEFDLVQAIRRERPCRQRGGGGRSMASDFLLTGLLRCAVCGGPMVGRHNDPTSPRGFYYFCLTRAQKGKYECHARAIQCHVLDGEVVGKLIRLYGAGEARQMCIAALAGEARGRTADLRAELAELQRQLARVEERERRVARDYAGEVLSLAEFRSLRAALQEEGWALRGAQETLRLRLRGLEAGERDQARLAGQVERLRLWEDLGMVQRKHLLREFVSQVRAARDDHGLACEMTWRVPAPARDEAEEHLAAD